MRGTYNNLHLAYAAVSSVELRQLLSHKAKCLAMNIWSFFQYNENHTKLFDDARTGPISEELFVDGKEFDLIRRDLFSSRFHATSPA